MFACSVIRESTLPVRIRERSSNQQLRTSKQTLLQGRAILKQSLHEDGPKLKATFARGGKITSAQYIYIYI